MNKQKPPRGHHYLPAFYLRGFADNDGMIYVYDKIKDTISKKTPESHFKVNHLNNFRFKGEVKFNLEASVFGPIDGKSAPLFQKIRNKDFIGTDDLTSVEKFELLGFVNMLYWRLPESTKVFAKLLREEGMGKVFSDSIDITNIPKEGLRDIENGLLLDDELLKVGKHTMAHSSASHAELFNLYDKFNICSITYKLNKLISGDQPILINNNDVKIGNLFNEYIFPISKYKALLVFSAVPFFFDDILINFINLSILRQSNRFIVSDEEQHIKDILGLRNRAEKENIYDDIMNKTFECIRFQSKFDNYNDYFQGFRGLKRKI